MSKASAGRKRDVFGGLYQRRGYFFKESEDCLLFQHILQPTWFRHGQCHQVPDLVFTNEENCVRDIKFCPGLGTQWPLMYSFFNNMHTTKFTKQWVCQIALGLETSELWQGRKETWNIQASRENKASNCRKSLVNYNWSSEWGDGSWDSNGEG